MMMFDALSPEFLVTALVVVLAPGTGVIYTLSTGIFGGTRASIAAAAGCTLGIVPHLAASLFGLAALLHASAVVFQTVKLAGVAYLLYMAWGLWRDTGSFALDGHRQDGGLGAVALRGIVINILNPKVSVFFLAFLPQFIPAAAPDALSRMVVLSLTFMAMTFAAFICYGIAANAMRRRVLGSQVVSRWMKRAFAGIFALFALRLAVAQR